MPSFKLGLARDEARKGAIFLLRCFIPPLRKLSFVSRAGFERKQMLHRLWSADQLFCQKKKKKIKNVI